MIDAAAAVRRGGKEVQVTPLTLLAYALAIDSVVDAYHNGSLFEGTREIDAVHAAAFEANRHRGVRVVWRNFFGAARACPFCFSYHVAAAFLLLHLVGLAVGGAAQAVILSGVYLLAAGRLAWLGNGLLPGRLGYCRSLPQEAPRWDAGQHTGEDADEETAFGRSVGSVFNNRRRPGRTRD